MVLLAKAIARKWHGVYANAVNPGWVPTKMGGAGAPDDLQKGAETQSWLAISNDPEALVSGRYFFHRKEKELSAGCGQYFAAGRIPEVVRTDYGYSFS